MSRGTFAPQMLGRAKYELSLPLIGPANARAARPAGTDRSRLSVRSCLTRRMRDAPIAPRIAISACRRAPADNTRFATFAHASSSRKPAAAIMMRVVDASASRAWGLIQVTGSSTNRRVRSARGAARSKAAANARNASPAPATDTPAASLTIGTTASVSRFSRVSDRAR